MKRKVALYDLARMPTTFDFAVYAVMAATLGYEEIRFCVGAIAEWKYSAETGWRRWANICIPMCALAGLKFSVGAPLQGDMLGYKTGDIEALYKREGKIRKLTSNLLFDDSGYVTVTMRESFRNKWRDSNRPEWAKIIAWLKERGEKVLILEECEMQPLALENRMVIYAQAKMNLAVGNGPMVLCWLSEAPYLSFQLPNPPGKEEKYAELVEQWNRMKFPVGSQLSFRNPATQEIVWGPDDFETVTRHYAQMFPETERALAAA